MLRDRDEVHRNLDLVASARGCDPVDVTSAQASTVDQKLIANLDAHRQRLLQLDARNPSVFTGRISKARRFDVCEHFAKKAPQVLERLLKGRGSFEFKLPKSGAQTQPLVSEHLRHVAKSAAEIEEETGVWNLRLGTCWLEGRVGPSNAVRAPLLLRPATLTRRPDGHRTWILQFVEGSELMLNESLLAALAKDLGWRAPSGLHDAIADAIAELVAAKTLDLGSLHRVVGGLLAAEGLIIHHASHSHEPLQPSTKANAVANGFEREGVARVHEATQDGDNDLAWRGYVVLGLFQQSSTALFADYAQLIDKANAGEVDQGIVDNLLEAPADTHDVLDSERAPSLDEMPAAEVRVALPCDPSQLQVLREAQTRECTVVRGPPGTGKSQVIANLAFDAMSRGERVLVVCQKRAALDVVMNRLQQCNVGEWAQVVHDSVADRKEVFQKLAVALEMSKESPQPGPTEQMLGLERRIDHTTSELAERNAALFAKFKGGYVRDLYRDAPSGIPTGGMLPAELLASSRIDLPELLDRLEPLWMPAARFRAASFPLSSRTSWARATRADLDAIAQALGVLQNSMTEVARPQTALAMRTDHDAIATMLANYNRLRTQWWRFFAPAWWRARAAYNVFAQGKSDPDAEATVLRSTQGAVATSLEALRPWFRPAWVEALAHAVRDVQQPPAAFAQLLQSLQRHGAEIIDVDAQLDAHPPWVKHFLERERDVEYAGDQGSDVGAWKQTVLEHARLRWIDEAESQYPVLRRVPSERYTSLRTQLAEALHSLPATTQQVVRQQIWERSTLRTHPPELQDSKKRPQTEFNNLAHQLGKQRRLYSLRRLFDVFSWQLRNLAPCWLMSPEVVSEVLPLERGSFDVVIFDEASQLPLERALPVLYRGRRIIVAGDEQQMPPTRFFQSIGGDDEDAEELAADNESLLAQSLLEQAKKIYGFRYLTWHYRSEFGELIEFSNRAFYDGTLCVTPSTTRTTAIPAIRYHAVEDGIWEQQSNVVEARACVDVLLDIARRCESTPRSVAIVTVNAKQQSAIDDALREREQADPQAARLIAALRNPASGSRDDALVIKNIENVQGDERDVVIFSTAYGPSANGRAVRRDFGAINQAGGENRLNVAFTRARFEMHVLCSFEPNDVVVEGLTNRGPAVLIRYLQYARAVSQGDSKHAESIAAELSSATTRHQPSAGDHFDSEFEAQVCEALRNRGLQVETQHGVGGYRIDLVVVHPKRPDQYILAVECDGATYHSAKSVRDRDVARQAHLERKGWNFARVWSRDWWKDPQRCIEDIVTRVGELQARTVDAETLAPTASPTITPSATTTPPSSALQHPTSEPVVHERPPHDRSGAAATKAAPEPSVTSPLTTTAAPDTAPTLAAPDTAEVAAAVPEPPIFSPPPSPTPNATTTATPTPVSSESANTVVSESSKTALSGSAKTAVALNSKTLLSESAKTVLEDAPSESAKTVLENAPSESAKTVLENAPSESAKTVLEDAPSESAKTVLEDAPSESAKTVLAKTPRSE